MCQVTMEHSNSKKRLVVAISGASGAQIGIQLLKAMQQFPEWETHLIISKGACRTIEEETDFTVAQVESLATKVYSLEDIGASIASGSFNTEGMIIVPCSMKTLAGIASGFSENAILRAADVTLKEGRKLVLVTRESPLSQIHLRNMLCLSKMGVVILPPVLTFYNHPTDISDLLNHIVGKVLDNFHLNMNGFKRWGESCHEQSAIS